MTKTNSSRIKAAAKITETKTFIYIAMIIAGFFMLVVTIIEIGYGFMTAALVCALIAVLLITAGFSCRWCADIKCGK